MKTYRQFITEMMTTQTPNGEAGFSSNSDDNGPVAGRSPKMFFLSRKFAKTYSKSGPNSFKIWLDDVKNKLFL
jgi:hypothetical protein